MLHVLTVGYVSYLPLTARSDTAGKQNEKRFRVAWKIQLPSQHKGVNSRRKVRRCFSSELLRKMSTPLFRYQMVSLLYPSLLIDTWRMLFTSLFWLRNRWRSSFVIMSLIVIICGQESYMVKARLIGIRSKRCHFSIVITLCNRFNSTSTSLSQKVFQL